MIHSGRRSAFSISAIVLGIGCATSSSDASLEAPGSNVQALSVEEQPLHVFKATRALADMTQLVEREQRLASLLGATTLQLATLSDHRDNAHIQAIRADGDLRSFHVPRSGELMVFRSSLLKDDLSAASASEEAARATFDETIGRINEMGILPDELSLETVRTSQRLYAVARSDEPEPTPIVNEYRFYTSAQTDGLRDACTRARIGVHKSGQVSFISVVSVCARQGATAVAAPTLSESLESAQTRFKADHPEATVLGWSTAYLPFVPGEADDAVEPYHLVKYVVKTVSDNVEVISRKQRLAYSALALDRTPVPLNGTVNPEQDVGDRR